MYEKNIKSAGFTLLELTISMALGIILSMSMIQLFGMVKQVVQRQEGILRIQESMQTSIFFMGQAIRSAGNMGCIKWQDAQTQSVLAPLDLKEIGLHDNNVIRITNKHELQTNKFIHKNVLAHMKPNTDILWVVGSVPASEGKKEKDVMMLCDCADIELFSWSDQHKGLRLEKDYKKLRRLTSVLYYINDKKELCSVNLNRNAQSHVEGVQDWKITLTAEKVAIQFVFAHLKAHLEWEQQWSVR